MLDDWCIGLPPCHGQDRWDEGAANLTDDAFCFIDGKFSSDPVPPAFDFAGSDNGRQLLGSDDGSPSLHGSSGTLDMTFSDVDILQAVELLLAGGDHPGEDARHHPVGGPGDAHQTQLGGDQYCGRSGPPDTENAEAPILAGSDNFQHPMGPTDEGDASVHGDEGTIHATISDTDVPHAVDECFFGGCDNHGEDGRHRAAEAPIPAGSDNFQHSILPTDEGHASVHGNQGTIHDTDVLHAVDECFFAGCDNRGEDGRHRAADVQDVGNQESDQFCGRGGPPGTATIPVEEPSQLFTLMLGDDQSLIPAGLHNFQLLNGGCEDSPSLHGSDGDSEGAASDQLTADHGFEFRTGDDHLATADGLQQPADVPEEEFRRRGDGGGDHAGGPENGGTGVFGGIVDDPAGADVVLPRPHCRRVRSADENPAGVIYHRNNNIYEAHVWIKLEKALPGSDKRGVQIFLGSYDTSEKAQAAHDRAAIKCDVGFDCHEVPYTLNFPEAMQAEYIAEHRDWTNRDFVWKLRNTSDRFNKGKSSMKGVVVKKRKVNGQEVDWFEARISNTVSGEKKLAVAGRSFDEDEAGKAYDRALLFINLGLEEIRKWHVITNFRPSIYSTEEIQAAGNNLVWKTVKVNKRKRDEVCEGRTVSPSLNLDAQ